MGLLAGGEGQRLLHPRLRRARAIGWDEDGVKGHRSLPFFCRRACKASGLPCPHRAGQMGWESRCVAEPGAAAGLRAGACGAVAPLPLLLLRSALCCVLPPLQNRCQAPSPSGFCVTRVASQARRDRVSPLCRLCLQTLCHREGERQECLDRACHAACLCASSPHRRTTQLHTLEDRHEGRRYSIKRLGRVPQLP
jgi:hypothetical protein